MKKLVAAGIFALLAWPVAAQEFTAGNFKATLYGELYLDGFYDYGSDKTWDGGGPLTWRGANQSFGTQSFLGSSALGVNMEWGNFSGTFELGINPDEIARLYYVSYNFENGGYLSFGKRTSIAAYYFGQVSNDGQSLNDYGSVTDNRVPMLMYGIKGFEAALIYPIWDPGFDIETYGINATTAYPGSRVFNTIPRLEIAYTYNNDVFEGKIFAGYAYFLINGYNDATHEKKDFGANAFHVGIGGKVDISDAFIQFTAFYGMNMYLTGALGNSALAPVLNNEGDGFKDVQSAGGAIGFGYAINEKITPQIGVGYMASFGSALYKTDDSLGAYLNAEFAVNDWFSITPEVAYLDDMNNSNGDREGYHIIAGVQLLASF